ncbi:hydantoinase/oxoprolinase family protein [uncultured Ruegeria sp.]|uniref:hydantoinase/oxoprolinase family protein n=1 Tax=uncultured Ruegeria sp. TaxID=259304 RepID=UPI00260B95C0|nr:hydantoinase/oxoprolinase family protein [uncultured Ruegeria sp.]
MNEILRIGVDVGGTNTDAALLKGSTVMATVKRPTSANVDDGVVDAIKSVLDKAGVTGEDVEAVMIGTTHFLNAVVERRHLQKVGVLRLCGPATRSLPPMVDWPEALREVVDGGVALVGGGVEFDGRPLAPLDEDAIRAQCRDWKSRGVDAVAICAVFALVDGEMERRAGEIVAEELPGAAISLSHRIGHTGLLKRESAAILNSSLTDLGIRTVAAFREAFARLGMTCPLYLTQNDGTVMSSDFAERFPIFTIASGPTNSMRGAAFLTGLDDAAVVDIGGTTTDIGLLVGGFPRGRGEGAKIADVQTNFRVPDVYSIGLGGGSIVQGTADALEIGPESVGYQIIQMARIFGGDVLTSSDIAVASGLATLGDASRVADLDPALVSKAVARMKADIEDVIDRMKPSQEPIPAILVGGGSILVGRELEGVSKVLKPEHFGSANAIGAAIAQVSGEMDTIVSLDGTSRDAALKDVISEATKRAVEAGASQSNIEITDISETPLAYLPGNAVRISVKVVGDLSA